MDIDVAAELLVGPRFCNHLPTGVFFGGIWDDLTPSVSWEGQGGGSSLPSDAQRGVRVVLGGNVALPKASQALFLSMPVTKLHCVQNKKASMIKSKNPTNWTDMRWSPV